MNEVRVVLLGRTGAGKSTSGNNILDKKTFLSSASGNSVTRQCQRGTAVRLGRRIEVIDTPGLFDTGLSQEWVLQEIVKCLALTAPGPHAFVLVLRLDRYTEEERECIEQFKRIFGPGMMKYLIILFTRKDDLLYDNKTVEKYVDEAPSNLKILIESCKNRYAAFNNRGTEDERSNDIKAFLRVIDDMVQENGSCYTNELYEQAEEAMRKRAEKIQEEAREKAEHRRRQIEEDYLAKMKSLEDAEAEKTSPLLAKIRELEDHKLEDSDQMGELKAELQELKRHMKDAQEKAAETKKIAEQDTLAWQGMRNETSRLQARAEVDNNEETVMGMLKIVGMTVLKEFFVSVTSTVRDQLCKVITAGFTRVTDKIAKKNSGSSQTNPNPH